MELGGDRAAGNIDRCPNELFSRRFRYRQAFSRYLNLRQ
jgi:hypothetical protein